MRDGVLLLGRHLGKGASFALGNKHRVVTEALRARHMVDDCTLDNALKEILLTAQNQRNNRTETRLAVALALEVFEEQGVIGVEVVLIACILFPIL